MRDADIDFIRELYEAHNSAGAGFPDLLLERDYLHPDVEFVEFLAVPGAATHRGQQAVADLFRSRFEAGELDLGDVEVTPIGERTALVTFVAHLRGTGSGAEASMRLWNVITLEDSRVARIEEFNDEAMALAAAATAR
jgi:ketosteroid isomerase-like protein